MMLASSCAIAGLGSTDLACALYEKLDSHGISTFSRLLLSLIWFFHMLHFILPCLVMSNICYMHTLDKVSTSGNFSSVLQGYDRTCYVIPWGRMDVPWPHHCAPEGDRFNSALQHLQRPPMVRAFTLVILCSIFFGFAACLRDIAGIACWIRQYFDFCCEAMLML